MTKEEKIKRIRQIDVEMLRIEKETVDSEELSGVGVHLNFIQWAKLYNEYIELTGGSND